MPSLSKTLVIFALVAAVAAQSACAAALIGRHFPKQTEAKVAEAWFAETLPGALREMCAANNFPRTRFMLDGNDKPGVAVEIRDVAKDNKSLVIHRLLRKDENDKGEPEYVADPEPLKITLQSWRARHMVECLDPAKNPDDKFLVGFAAWLYADKEPRKDLARRVLAALFERNAALRESIGAYIIEREKLSGARQDGFDLQAEVDRYKEGQTSYAVEHKTLLTNVEKINRDSRIEREAEAALKEIAASLGDFGKPAKVRKNLPTKFLVLIKWDIQKYRERFKGTKFLAGKEIAAMLDKMEKSVEDDWKAIAEARRTADKQKTADKKAEALLEVIKLDPHDIRLARDCALLWVEYAQIADNGKSCTFVKGCDNAAPIFRDILDRRPGNTSYMYNLARCHQVKREDKAKDLYREIIRLEGKASEIGKKADQMLRNMGE